MKKVLSGICIPLILSGCMVDPVPSIDLMKGSGSVNRAVDGRTAFRYVVSADAYNGVVNAPDELRKQHEWLIGSYLGEGGHCPNGYQITNASLDSAVGAYVYEGICR
ncbi:hypothetical protein [Rhodovulum sulfidophilum]|uniref:hypothetical protein n=1 Tax=Rhodovulum sulfidophilum TaxID=35806 RepID=UPI0019234793|nr:hypothetical protein [Rhodovulum sulfidophilum]MBL3576348.1 hypothetical protein [Rhodovulum sulfidophilum]